MNIKARLEAQSEMTDLENCAMDEVRQAPQLRELKSSTYNIT